VPFLLVLGANRSGKSCWAAKRMNQLATYSTRRDRLQVCLDTCANRSKTEQQKLFWRYLVKAWRVAMRRTDTLIQWNAKNGFTNDSLVNPRGTFTQFFTYTQDLRQVSEGREPNEVWMDEDAPPDWVDTWTFRLATRHGHLFGTYTPVDGYTPYVAQICDGGTVTWDAPGYLLPRDGGKPAEYATLGLTAAEYEETLTARKEKPPRQALAPATRGFDVLDWLRAGRDYERLREAAMWPELRGRSFTRVPRVMRSANPRWAVIYFHGSDNPYGGSEEIMADALHSRKGTSEIKIRCYGWAEKAGCSTFRKFDPAVHVVKHATIPSAGETVMLLDPHPERNWACAWIRNTGRAHYMVWEWPSRADRVPGLGVLEPWAVPSARWVDGAPGDGQKNLGFGYWRYKAEWARIEGWTDYERWLKEAGARRGLHGSAAVEAMLAGELVPTGEQVAAWDERNGARMPIAVRLMDPRVFGANKVGFARTLTLADELAEVGVYFQAARGGQKITDGVEKVNALLDWDPGQQLGFLNEPHLYVSEKCENAIFALNTWQGKDGEKGATKEWVDLLRWYALWELGVTWAGAPERPRRETEEGEPDDARGARGRIARAVQRDDDETVWEV
jgi:hypothetical protein